MQCQPLRLDRYILMQICNKCFTVITVNTLKSLKKTKRFNDIYINMYKKQIRLTCYYIIQIRTNILKIQYEAT